MAQPTPAFDPLEPFLLRPDGPDSATLLASPCAIMRADAPEDVPAALAAARVLAKDGRTLAGGLAFEAAEAFHPRFRPAAKATGPLLWFGAFAAARQVRLSALAEGLAPARLGPLRPLVDARWHEDAVQRLKALIAAGDIYQANLTFQADLPFAGTPLALFLALWARAPAAHGALVHTGDQWWISLSPELFFTLSADGLLTARPMKGTAPRHADPAADSAAAAALGADAKNRAENLMITDLLRHDMARVAKAGSVRVPQLFTLERHAYVHQMTSTITARLAPGEDALSALAALFPCGSVTGAPKLRALQVIAAVEAGPRGPYCGAIAIIGPGARTAWVSVPIRTLVVDRNRPDMARLGLGSGIVADSEAQAEWAECLAKARFLEPQRPETLIETMRRTADGGIPLLERHLSRLSSSAARFGFALDAAALRARLCALPAPAGPERLRLLLDISGAVTVQRGPAPANPAGPVRVSLAPHPLPRDDWRLAHKSGTRDFWRKARNGRTDFDTLFVRGADEMTEGSFTSLFVREGGRLRTPPLAAGVLPGVLRAELLDTGEAVEAPLHLAEVRAASSEGRLFVGNALRGLLPAILDE